MKKASVLVVATVMMVALLFAGCTTFDASGLEAGIIVDGRKYEKVKDFSEKEWTNKFLGWGINGGTLFNLSSGATDPVVLRAIKKHLKKYGIDGEVGVVDLRIRYGNNPLQWILSAVTLCTWMPGTVTISGTIVKAVDSNNSGEADND